MRFDLRSVYRSLGIPAAVVASGYYQFAVAQTTPPAATAPPAAAAGAPADSTAAPAAAPAGDPKELLGKGDAALKAGDFQAAIDAYGEANQVLAQPKSNEEVEMLIRAQVGRANALAGQKNYPAALEIYKTILDSQAGQIPTVQVLALVGQGKAQLETNEVEQALTSFETAVKADSKSAEAQFGLGKTLATLGRNEEAIAPLTKAIEADAKNSEALRLRAIAYAGTFKNKEAIDDLQKSIAINPDDQESLYTLGMIYVRNEDYEHGVEFLKKSIEHYKPKPGQEGQPYVQGYLTAASAYVELGKVAKDEAIRKKAYQASYDLCKTVIAQLDSKNPAFAQARAAALYNQGIAERMLGDYSSAIRSFSQAIELNPELGEAYFRRGICFQKINEDKMAIADFQSAAHLNSGDPRCNLWEGFTFSKLGDYNEAVRAYGDAIAASDRYTPAYYNRALAYMMMKDYDKAINDFNQAIRLAPTNAEYYYKRGLGYEMQKDFKRAADSFATALEFDPKHVEADRHMAAVQQALGRSDLANQYRQKAEELTLPPKKNP